MNPTILAAMINQIAIPELIRWLASLHAEGRVVTEAEALEKLQMDRAAGDAAGAAFLEATGG